MNYFGRLIPGTRATKRGASSATSAGESAATDIGGAARPVSTRAAALGAPRRGRRFRVSGHSVLAPPGPSSSSADDGVEVPRPWPRSGGGVGPAKGSTGVSPGALQPDSARPIPATTISLRDRDLQW